MTPDAPLTTTGDLNHLMTTAVQGPMLGRNGRGRKIATVLPVLGLRSPPR